MTTEPQVPAAPTPDGHRPSLLLTAAGNAWLTTLHPGITTGALAAPLLTIGTGQGLSIGIIDAQALSMVAPSEVGMASGFLNTVRGGTGAVVLTVFGALLLASVESRVGSGRLGPARGTGDVRSGRPRRGVHGGLANDALDGVGPADSTGRHDVRAAVPPAPGPGPLYANPTPTPTPTDDDPLTTTPLTETTHNGDRSPPCPTPTPPQPTTPSTTPSTALSA
ncbi:hypothetical protein [Streptomyces sp. NPDC046939]|uniref:hypothetical protein n=1 Tax=Streptomyces sp. NPDC046939 TaxID=3155376 RepID=UPI0033DFCF4A